MTHAAIARRSGGTRVVHGLSKRTKEYLAWVDMRARCYNSRSRRFHRYGGRGIAVCQRWLDSFANFLSDMGTAPTPAHSLDRIENDLGYSPGNCRWATAQEQGNNRADCAPLTAFGETKTLSEWMRDSRCVPMTHTGIRHRLYVLRWPVERSLTERSRIAK